ncbi:MAG: RpiB/LacA/LacB family sugar-phosphate isomerase [Planctomycetaceae bacterium]|jgi:ribose 5-phosphate isomerase B|nr:RpiB/LacA/LacB family sugar-phosphate isomerase [Planctomycetaceae bacterium]
MKIIIGSPVKGFALKETLKKHLTQQGHQIVDTGCYSTEKFAKYPSIGERVAYSLVQGEGELAINICGSGTGAAIGIDKFSGVLAIASESVKTARLARIVNGANCLCLGEDIVTQELACEIADAFIQAEFLNNPDAKPEIKNFWLEAYNEMLARGTKPVQREIEYLD